MICKACKGAGNMNRLGRDKRDENRPEEAEAAFGQARLYHLHCTGCDCQHIVGMKLHD
jgi:hypothetical protein